MSRNPLVGIGPRNVVQIVPTRNSVRPHLLHDDDAADLANRPLQTPTGPGGAKGFHNVAGSQIGEPHTTNVYLGPFWGNRAFVEGFSKAIVENGYLDPLHQLHYGTGSGKYLGSIDGPSLKGQKIFKDSQAQQTVAQLIDAGILHADDNSLFMLILPNGVTSEFDSDGSKSCDSFCGYHDAFTHVGTSVAYAVLPSTKCQGCGGLIGDFTAVYAHELAEAATDKVPGQGWVADDGEENGDLEAWILLKWGPPTNPGLYTIQGYYTNERGNTIGAWRGAATTHAAHAADNAIHST